MAELSHFDPPSALHNAELLCIAQRHRMNPRDFPGRCGYRLGPRCFFQFNITTATGRPSCVDISILPGGWRPCVLVISVAFKKATLARLLGLGQTTRCSCCNFNLFPTLWVPSLCGDQPNQSLQSVGSSVSTHPGSSMSSPPSFSASRWLQQNGGQALGGQVGTLVQHLQDLHGSLP